MGADAVCRVESGQVDASPERSVVEGDGFGPGGDGAPGAEFGARRGVGEGFQSASAVLVDFGAADSYERAFGAWLEVDDVQGDEFGAAERSDVANEQECSVSDAAGIGAA